MRRLAGVPENASQIGDKGSAERKRTITEPSGDDLLGSVTLVLDRRYGSGELGFFLLPEVRGRGLCSAAVRLVAGYAFEHLGVGRLVLLRRPDNDTAATVATRCGFRVEGALRGLPARRWRPTGRHRHVPLLTDVAAGPEPTGVERTLRGKCRAQMTPR